MDSSGRLEELKLLWETDPTAKVYLQLADEYRRLGQTAEAVQVLETTLAQRPRDPRGRVALARCRMDLGELGEATRLLEEVIKLDPAHAVASKLLLECHLQARDGEKASERFNIYRLLNDRDPELDHLEFRLRRLVEHPEEVDEPGLPAGPASPPGPGATTAAGTDFSSAAEVDPRVAALELSFGVHPPAHSAPATAALPATDLTPATPAAAWPDPTPPVLAAPVEPAQAAPAFQSVPITDEPAEVAAGRDTMSQDDPFGSLLQPLEVPKADLFAFFSPEAPASEAPSFDDLWGAPAEVAPAKALEPIAAPSVDPFAAFLPAAAPAARTADPFGELLSSPASPPAAPGFDFAPPRLETPVEREAPLFEFSPALDEGEGFLDAAPPALEPAVNPVDFKFAVGGEPAADESDSDEPAVLEPKAYDVTSVDDEPTGATATLGEVYLKQGHWAEAEQIFRQVLEREPNNAASLAGLSQLAGLQAAAASSAISEHLTPAEPTSAAEPVAAEPFAIPAEPAAEPFAAEPFAAEPFAIPAEPAAEPFAAEPFAIPDELAATVAEPVFAPLVETAAVAEPDFAAAEPFAAETFAATPKTSADSPRLDAAFLLAQRTLGDAVPEGLTAKKVLILRRYLEHIRPTRANHVQ